MKVFLIAGEVSGDRLGGTLMEGLRDLVPEVAFAGVGGPQMQAQGLDSLFPMDELSVMGIAEIAPKYRALKRRIAQTAQAVLDADPDVLVTIDSPDFVLRVAALVKARRNIRIVHYVAPSVWAWRPGRADRMARVVDQVLALLPFEPPYMERAGMRCDFVGHPVVSEPVPDAADEAVFRAAHGLGDAPVLLALPGSRRSEVGRLLPIFGPALDRVRARHPDLRVVIPAAGPVAGAVRETVAGWATPPVVTDPEAAGAAQIKRGAFRAGRAALAASGTVSLELAAARTPMVIAYRFNWLSWQIISRMAQVDTVTLVNLVSGTRAVPECLGPACTPDRVAAALEDVLRDPSEQHAAMARTMTLLGEGGDPPGQRAARAVLDGLSPPVGVSPR